MKFPIGLLCIVIYSIQTYAKPAYSKSLPESEWKSSLSDKTTPVKLYEATSKSVWMVIAPAGKKQISQGSAVAISNRLLLTNCHVVGNKSTVLIKQDETFALATVHLRNEKQDRCILSVKDKNLSSVDGMRPFSDLKVGEEIFTIGSPQGLESTLSQGMISGLRKNKEENLIQITAPISKGSSGGAVLDSHGNLLGITTFVLKESQNLNFAIAIDDYFDSIPTTLTANNSDTEIIDSDSKELGKESKQTVAPNQGRKFNELRQMPGNPRPQYERQERLRGDQGVVVFVAYVSKDGHPSQFRLTKSTGFRNLDAKTLTALKKWRFYPGQEGWIEIPIRWDLKGGAQESSGLLRSKTSLKPDSAEETKN